MSSVAGHDINYISIAGVLGAMARQGERPLFPLNLVGDYGGGGMLLAFGVVCGVLEARSSGQGQVVDAAMVDGAATLLTIFHGLRAGGIWRDEPGTNVLDSGAHFYEVYETSDGGYISVGAIEPQFYAELLRLLELRPGRLPAMGQRPLAGVQGAVRGAVHDDDPRRVGGAARARRRLRDRRCSSSPRRPAPAHGRARGRSSSSTASCSRAGAALQPHGAGDYGSALARGRA